MSAIRTHAMRLLRDIIADAIPELKGKICAGPTEAPHVRIWPHLSLIPGRQAYEPHQADEHKELGSTRLVMDVGYFQGPVQLRLGATTADKRADLEEKLLAVFQRHPGHPGVIFATVPEVHDAVISWDLDESEWEDELAFTKKWFSLTTITMTVPALVTRDGVYTIEDLRLALTEDLTTDYDDLPASSIETVSIDEDGNITIV